MEAYVHYPDDVPSSLNLLLLGVGILLSRSNFILFVSYLTPIFNT